MRMKLQALSPAMEHAEEADLGPEVSRIAGDLKQGLSTGVKEQVVDEPFVLQRERGQFPRQSEHGMDVASGQQFPLARLEPSVGARCPGISGNGDFCMSCKRWQLYVRSRCSDRDVRPAQRCDSVLWPATLFGVRSEE